MDIHPDSLVIDKLGGSTSTAALCAVSPQAVSQWRRTGIPKPRRMYLRLLRPDAFDDDRTALGEQASSPQVTAPRDLADAPAASGHLAPDQSRIEHLWLGNRRSDPSRPDRNEKASSSKHNERQSRPSERRG